MPHLHYLFTFIRVGHNYYCLFVFYSFSIHFRDHLATILNVSVGFLFLFCVTCSLFTLLVPFLLYLFLFGLSLFLLLVPFRTKLVTFSSPKGNNPHIYLVSFYLPCVFFLPPNLSQKRHNLCFFCTLPCALFIFTFYSYLLVSSFLIAREWCTRTKNGNSV